jgi:hypothetical protein
MAYVIGIIGITIRSKLNNQDNKRSMSVLCFGTVCGLCYGTALSLLTDIAEDLHWSMILFGIFTWGVAGGLLAVIGAYIISLSFIKNIRAIVDRMIRKN